MTQPVTLGITSAESAPNLSALLRCSRPAPSALPFSWTPRLWVSWTWAAQAMIACCHQDFSLRHLRCCEKHCCGRWLPRVSGPAESSLSISIPTKAEPCQKISSLPLTQTPCHVWLCHQGQRVTCLMGLYPKSRRFVVLWIHHAELKIRKLKGDYTSLWLTTEPVSSIIAQPTDLRMTKV